MLGQSGRETLNSVFKKKGCRRAYNSTGDDLPGISVPNKMIQDMNVAPYFEVENDRPEEVLKVITVHIKHKWLGWWLRNTVVMAEAAIEIFLWRFVMLAAYAGSLHL